MPLSVENLLENLDDPFVFFPLQSVCRSLNELVRDNDESMMARMGPSGVARKSWDVPTELMHEEVGRLLGAAFVLGQATITQTVALLKRIRLEAGANLRLPEKKSEMLELASPHGEQKGRNAVLVIDLAANYFKHHQEWPDDWAATAGKADLQTKTIQGCRDLGMRPGSFLLTDNLYSALHVLGRHPTDVSTIEQTIRGWRGRLARGLYAALDMADPNLELPV